KRRESYHAFGSTTDQLRKRRDERLRQLKSQALSCRKGALTSEQSKRIGQFLHALEDRRSHEGYDPPTGHLMDGHGPDKPWSPGVDYRPSDTVRMIEEKFEDLVAIRIACTTHPKTVATARQEFARIRKDLDAWEKEEERIRAPGTRGDDQSPQRWIDL